MPQFGRKRRANAHEWQGTLSLLPEKDESHHAPG